MIIVDDLSTDDSKEIVERYSQKDHRIRLIRLEHKSGPARARNKAISEAKGRYIAFLDADDIWLETKLEQQLEFMKAHDSAFSFTGYSIYHGNGNFGEKVIDSNTLDIITYRDLLKKSCTVGCSTVILDRTKLPKIEMVNIRTGQDYALWLMLLRESGLIAHNFKRRLTGYRLLEGSISRNKFKKAKRQWQIYREIENINFFSAIYFMFFYAKNAVFRK